MPVEPGPETLGSEVVTADLSGRTLGHYRVDGVIGRGGMSVVYKAVDTRLDRPVALKVMSEDLSNDDEFRVRFTEEARAASAIDHVNVVPLYDFGEAEGWLFIAMRLVIGTDLAKEVAYGQLPVRRTLELLNQVGAALDMLHGRGLVHLDVKPANVLITRNESSGSEHVYVADFGLTRRGATGHRTASGDFLGSPSYASPEHLRGQEVQAPADLYSLTCMLFTCLAGRAPFVGDVQTVITGHLRGQVPSLSALTGLSSGIDRVIARGMAAEPSARYPTSADLLGSARRALTSLRDEDPVPSPTPAPTPVADATRPSGPPLSGWRGSAPSGPDATTVVPSSANPAVSGPRPPYQGPPTGSGQVQRPGPGQHNPATSGPYRVNPGVSGPHQVPSGYPPAGYPQQGPRPQGPPGPAAGATGPRSGSPPPDRRWLWVALAVVVAVIVVGAIWWFASSGNGSEPPGQTPTPTTPATSSVVLPTQIEPSLITTLPG